MRSTALFIFCTSLMGFFFFHGTTFFRYRPLSPLVHKLPGLPKIKSDASGIWVAMVTGEDRFIAKATKKTYFQLGLGHLFTPSGTHLSTLGPIIKALPYGRMLYLPIGLLSLLIPGLIPLARVSWIKATQAHRFGFSFFALALIFEGALYSWSRAPMSWVCSWLFLGLTYFAPRRTLILWYILAQMLLVWVFHQSFSLLSPITAFFFGAPLALFFPVVFTCSLFPWTFIQTGVLLILEKWHWLIITTAKIHGFIPLFSLHFGHLLFVLGLISIPGKFKTRVLAILLLGLSTPTGPWFQTKDLSSKWELTSQRDTRIESTKPKEDGVQVYWSDGTSCMEKLENGIWLENCRTQKWPGKRRSKFMKLSLKR